MPTWCFRWSQRVIFTGPIFEVTSEVWHCSTPTMLRRARACSLNLQAHAGGPRHAFMQQSASETQPCMRALDAVVVWNWRVDYFELLSSSPQDHESPQSCWGNVAHVPEPKLRSKVGYRGKLSRAASVSESNQTRSLESLSVREKTKRSCTTVARFPTWCPHLQRKHPSKVVGPTVVTSLGFSCHPPLLQLRLSLSLSVCVALWVLSSYY